MFKIIPLNSRQHLLRLTISKIQNANAHVAATTAGHHHHPEKFDISKAYPRIGKREIVGFGPSGEPNYFDLNACPLPAIRWKEDTEEIRKLREKAKGDWANLTIAEKKERKLIILFITCIYIYIYSNLNKEKNTFLSNNKKSLSCRLPLDIL